MCGESPGKWKYVPKQGLGWAISCPQRPIRDLSQAGPAGQVGALEVLGNEKRSMQDSADRHWKEPSPKEGGEAAARTLGTPALYPHAKTCDNRSAREAIDGL